ncbi:MAG: hypothetical protein JKY37_27220 [Nannocystaceae bacterium]|nr:hypothetical protein [Nannocystaceae bacterium]
MACEPTPKGGGVLDSGADADAGDDAVGPASSGDDGATSGVSATSGGSATASGDGNDSDGDGDSATVGPITADGDDDNDGDGGSTGGGTPAACLDVGWDDSLAVFEAMAQSAQNTYWYTGRTGGHGFDSQFCTYETTVEVTEGVVTRRAFTIVGTPQGVLEEDCEVEPFEETGAAINETSNGFDLPAATMETKYAGCCDLLALEPAEDYMTSFEVDEGGIVSHCCAVHANCADTCGAEAGGFFGFTLLTFNWGESPQ